MGGIHHCLPRIRACLSPLLSVRRGSRKVLPRPQHAGGEMSCLPRCRFHFFLKGGLFLALRVFHTASLQSTTAWLHEPGLGTVELVNTYTPLAADRAAPGLFLEGEEITIADGGDGSVAIDLRPTSASAIAALRRAQVSDGASTGRPELRLRADEGHAFGWIPAGADVSSDGPVIHRPQMTARVASWRGEEVSGYGYSKRYYAVYPRHNGWRFIHGVSGPHLSGVVDSGAGSGAAPVAPSPDSPTPPSIVWTADATFGDYKYNYFKLLAPEGHGSGQLRESAQARARAHTHTHTNLTHAHWALHFECRGAPVV